MSLSVCHPVNTIEEQANAGSFYLRERVSYLLTVLLELLWHIHILCCSGVVIGTDSVVVKISSSPYRDMTKAEAKIDGSGVPIQDLDMYMYSKFESRPKHCSSREESHKSKTARLSKRKVREYCTSAVFVSPRPVADPEFLKRVDVVLLNKI